MPDQSETFAVVWVGRNNLIKFVAFHDDEGAALDDCEFHIQSLASDEINYHVVSLSDDIAWLASLAGHRQKHQALA